VHNSTNDSWDINDVPINATPGSGISVTTISQTDLPPQLRIFYQGNDGNVYGASFVSAAQIGKSPVTPDVESHIYHGC
jgi:hypothetical protein